MFWYAENVSCTLFLKSTLNSKYWVDIFKRHSNYKNLCFTRFSKLCINEDTFTYCINFRSSVSFFFFFPFPLLISEIHNYIWLESMCILQPILIFHLQIVLCNVLFLWCNNENVSVYSHYRNKVKWSRTPGDSRTTICEFKLLSYNSHAPYFVNCMLHPLYLQQ